VLLLIGVAILVGIVLACVLVPIVCGALGLGAASSVGAFRQNGAANILAGLFVFLGPTVLIAILLGLLLSTLANVFTSSVWTLAYRQWNQPAAALQPVAPPVEPVPPIESSTAVNPPAHEPPPGDGL
jgi:hypothetical protein